MVKLNEAGVLSKVMKLEYGSRDAAMGAMRSVTKPGSVGRKKLLEAINKHYPKQRGRSLPTIPRDPPSPSIGQLQLNKCLEMRVVKVEDLHTNPAQPDLRTTATAMAPLIAAIRRSRVITPPMVAPDVKNPGTYIIGDGHRRVEAARALGLTELQVCVYHIDDVREFWSICNINRPVRPEEWLGSWAAIDDRELRNKHLTSFPGGTKKQIIRCLEIWGEDRLREIGRDSRQSPAINTFIFWLADALGTSRDTKGSLAPKHPLATVGNWMVKHHMHRRIVEFRQESNQTTKGEPDLRRLKAIYKAILNDEPWDG